MKTFSLLTLSLIISLTFFSCKKSDPGSASTTQNLSTWTINGTAYSGDSSYVEYQNIGSYNKNSYATATGYTYISLSFANVPAAGTYTVIAGSNIPTGNTQVALEAGVGNNDYLSTGATGDKITVTISGGKVVASFSNISVIQNGTTVKLSGTIIAAQQ
jgi:hypothetical protein